MKILPTILIFISLILPANAVCLLEEECATPMNTLNIENEINNQNFPAQRQSINFMPNENINNIQTIPKSAFFECINLYDIQLPECLEMIETEAFYNCKELEFIVIPKNTSYIDGTAFYDCWNLKDNPVMEDYIICGEECNEAYK